MSVKLTITGATAEIQPLFSLWWDNDINQIETVLNLTLENEAIELIVVDLSRIRYVTLSAIGVISGAVISARWRDKRLVFCNVDERVRIIFHITKIDQDLCIAFAKKDVFYA